MSERFSINVNVTESAGSDNGSGSSKPGCGAPPIGLALLLAIFGGIGNSVFSGNTMTYAPTTITSTNMGVRAVFIIFLLIVLLALIVLASLIWLAKRASQ